MAKGRRSRGRSRVGPTITVYRAKDEPGEQQLDVLHRRRAYLRRLGGRRTPFQNEELRALDWAIPLLAGPDARRGGEP